MKKIDPNSTDDLRATLEKTLPDFWPRTRTAEVTGGILTAKGLTGLMSAGKGPSGTYRCGRRVVIQKAPFIDWLIARSTRTKQPVESVR